MSEGVLSRTESVCPVCLRRINASRVMIDGDIYLMKTCPEHGVFQTVLWRGTPDFVEWGQARRPDAAKDDSDPKRQGLPI